VSFDVVWSTPITRRVNVPNGTLGNNYTGEYVENQVAVTWSGTNLATGFSFTSNPGTFATSFFDGGFAELAHEQNGIFSASGSTDTANRVQANAELVDALAAGPAHLAWTETALVAPPIAAGPAAANVTSSRAVQAAPSPGQPGARAAHAPVIDQLFADQSGEFWKTL
jgi:hypothetical protein